MKYGKARAKVMTDWRKASCSVNNGQCAEVRNNAHTVLIRDTEDRNGTVLAFTPSNWQAFINSLKHDADAHWCGRQAATLLTARFDPGSRLLVP